MHSQNITCFSASVGYWSLADDMMPTAAAPEARMCPSLRNAPGFATKLPLCCGLCTKLRANLLPRVAWRACSCNVARDRSADVASETARTDIRGLCVTPKCSIRSLCPVRCARLRCNAGCIRTPRSAFSADHRLSRTTLLHGAHLLRCLSTGTLTNKHRQHAAYMHGYTCH